MFGNEEEKIDEDNNQNDEGKALYDKSLFANEEFDDEDVDFD